MTWAPGPVVTRRRLGGELKRLRDQSGLKLDEVARQLECSPSKISRLENGKGLPKWRDVRDLLDVYGVPGGETRDRLLEWSRTGQQPLWWRAYADVFPPGFDTYIDLEWDASRICAYEAQVVHGLLQTAEYARAMIGGAWASGDRQRVDRMIEVRAKRQHVLSAEHGLEFRCVLDESALYRLVSSSAVMRRQIEHLIAVAEAEHVDLRVLPFSAGPVGAYVESFAKLEFSEGLERGVVHVEHRDGSTVMHDDPDTIGQYEARMGTLLGAALSEDESIPLLRAALERHQT